MYKNHLNSLDHELTIRSNSQVTVLFDAPIVLTWPTKMKTWNAILYKIIKQRLWRIRITSLSTNGLKLEGFSHNFKTMILEICFEELAFIFFSPRLFIMLAIISMHGKFCLGCTNYTNMVVSIRFWKFREKEESKSFFEKFTTPCILAWRHPLVSSHRVLLFRKQTLV